MKFLHSYKDNPIYIIDIFTSFL